MYELCSTWREDGNVETARVVEKQILVHFLDKVAVVSTVVIQPEDSGHPCSSSSGDSQSNLAIIVCTLSIIIIY